MSTAVRAPPDAPPGAAAGGGAGLPMPMGPPGADWRYAQLAHEPPASPTQVGSQTSLAPLTGGGAQATRGGGDGHRIAPRRTETDDTEDAGAWPWQAEDLVRAARTRKVGWVAPAVVLLVALFLQNAGLYFGTSCYVRWMDELAEPVLPPSAAAAGTAPSGEAEGGGKKASERATAAAAAVASAAGHLSGGARGTLQNALTLVDPLAEYIRGLRSSEEKAGKEDGTWGAEFSVDLMTSLVSALWLGWVARTHDLRLWTRGLLSGAVLAALKGLLAWSTVLPDASGWDGCRERLGPDGLMYYRELSSGGSGDGGISGLQALQDIVLLEVRGLWMMGRASRQRVCADTVFSIPTCFCVLFAVSLYDAVRSSTKPLDANRRTTVLALAGTLLVLVLLADLTLTVSSPHHYTVDVATALPLTLMVYGSPAVCVAAERWAEVCGEDEEEQQHEAVGSRRCNPDVEAAPGSRPVKDLGLVTVPPCGVPFCSIGGLYYMREEPGSLMRKPWTEDNQKQHERQVAEFAQIRERDAGRRRQVEEDLEEAQRRAHSRAGEADAKVDARLEEKEKQLRAEEERALAEARQRLEAEQRALAASEAKATAELERIRRAERGLRERRARLEGDVDQAKREAREAQDAIRRHAAGAHQHREEAQGLQALLLQLRGELESRGVQAPPAAAA